jgi:transcriptional regulator with PAS, ATPase and Fis domain
MAVHAAASDAPVILSGETGVGKECFAKMIHENSTRSDKVFLAVNCGAIPKELIGSELFGYAPGAFTGAFQKGNAGKIESANGGTLFLDELSSLPLEAQIYLLRVIEENELFRLGSNNPVPIDVRMICATNTDLRELIRRKEFRADLYYRLNVVEIEIPPLRDRLEDMNDLISFFSMKYFGEPYTVCRDVFEYIRKYAWPGNLRELKNVIQRASALNTDVAQALLHYAESNLTQEDRTMTKTSAPKSNDPSLLAETRRVVEEYGGNIARAAKHLGIARSTVYRRLAGRE